jgi:hypothetical protein
MLHHIMQLVAYLDIGEHIMSHCLLILQENLRAELNDAEPS